MGRICLSPPILREFAKPGAIFCHWFAGSLQSWQQTAAFDQFKLNMNTVERG